MDVEKEIQYLIEQLEESIEDSKVFQKYITREYKKLYDAIEKRKSITLHFNDLMNQIRELKISDPKIDSLLKKYDEYMELQNRINISYIELLRELIDRFEETNRIRTNP
jgi:methyl-accepting chemotaxis protein